MNKIQLILIFTILLCAGNIYAQNKGTINPNLSVSAIIKSGENSFGASFFGLSNKQKQGQVGAGVGFYPIPGGDLYIPIFLAARIKFTHNAIQPMLDWHVGYGVYNGIDTKGRLYTNAGIGFLFPGKKVKPFVTFKYELRQFQLKREGFISRHIYNYNYFNASIGLSI